VVTDPQTNTQADRGDYNTLRRSLARSVIKIIGIVIVTESANGDHVCVVEQYLGDSGVFLLQVVGGALRVEAIVVQNGRPRLAVSVDALHQAFHFGLAVVGARTSPGWP